MRLYIPNGSVASGRFISPRRRCRGGKIPQPRRGWFFRPGAGEGGTADRPGLIFPDGNQHGNFIRLILCVPYTKINTIWENGLTLQKWNYAPLVIKNICNHADLKINSMTRNVYMSIVSTNTNLLLRYRQLDKFYTSFLAKWFVIC